jgi:hypothetical protein
MRTTASQFSEQKYVLLPSLLQRSDAALLYDYARDWVRSGDWTGDVQLPHTPARYGEPRMEALLVTLLPRIEAETGLSLHPTYSYLRVYKQGDVLARHTDRASCEISVSVSLGYEAETPWPLWIEGAQGATAVYMEPGDAVVYRGIECFHWRDAFHGERAAQVFIHYVDQHGPFAEWQFDKRRAVGVAPRLSAYSLTA